ncbi:porin family protein [Rhodohalobacter sp.]|uniref:porin family protein n=1 Tax=Rhodohalobacter sp. TaxID=1974210 RepID=UPI0035673D23
MKFYFISIITIMVLAAGTVTAQHTNIGIKGGLNSYNINSDNGSGFDSKIGLHIGLLGHIHLKDQIAFQPELVYSMQGTESGNTDINLDYINIPLLFQYMYDNGFRIQAGPQLGFLLNAKAENGSSVDIKDDFKTMDLGLSVGASYVHTPTGFGVDARYNLGLSDISENSSNELTNRGVQLGVFYLFGHRN